ncbi:MAG TPA: DciA family protein [Candidatus Saccharimonadales bacterium]|nr:DciA family protein [Candidatus Saccharimonadales bacterium]
MKNIQDILKRKAGREARGEKKELDEKTIGRVFLEAAKGEIKNIEDGDIREMKIKEKTLYVKTAHPVVSSELFLRKEKILEKTNEIAGGKVIEKVIIG